MGIVMAKANLYREKKIKKTLSLSFSLDYYHDQENISKIQMC
jgi:hypothetical protein